MRIRKHAKISPLLYASSSLKPGTVVQTHVCQLNQSPWDIITFPPPDHSTLPPPPAFLVDKDYSYMSNGFLADHIAADESPKKWDDIAAGESFDNGGSGTEFEKEEPLRLKKEEEGSNISCIKADGRGWLCRRKAKDGHPFCERHLSQLKNDGNLTQPALTKSPSRRRGRPRKPSSSSNPYEFYYYSGFGPRWGKKRGPGSASAAIKEEPYKSQESSSEDVAEGPKTPQPNSKSSISISISSRQIDNERFDYVEEEEEEDEDENENGEIGRKRGRKPIKARSLKSLM